MPPKTVTCSICSAEVLKAQTLARADGSRACRSHEGVTAEAEQLAADVRARLNKQITEAGKPAWLNDPKHLEEQAVFSAKWEKEAAAWREHLYSHCWTCGEYGLEGREFFAQAMIAMKRLELRGEFSFLSYGDDVRKLMGGVRFLASIQLQNEVIDRAIVKHVTDRRIRDIVPFLRFVLICPPCAEKHGFKKRLEDLMPKPTWEQIEAIGPVVAAIEPLVRELAEKKERQS